MSWVRDREFTPTIGGNDTAPEDRRVVITYKPFAVGEKADFVAKMQARGVALVDASKAARERLEEIGEDDDVSADDVAEVLRGIAAAEDDALRFVFEERITGGRRGDDKVSGWQSVWENVKGDDELVAEIASAIVESLGVGDAERPTSAPPSTGGERG